MKLYGVLLCKNGCIYVYDWLPITRGNSLLKKKKTQNTQVWSENSRKD